jgi:hypothetical protein
MFPGESAVYLICKLRVHLVCACMSWPTEQPVLLICSKICKSDGSTWSVSGGRPRHLKYQTSQKLHFQQFLRPDQDFAVNALTTALS